MRRAALMPGPSCSSNRLCCQGVFLLDELASLAPIVVVNREDKVADRVLEELGFAPVHGDDGLHIISYNRSYAPGVKIQDDLR